VTALERPVIPWRRVRIAECHLALSDRLLLVRAQLVIDHNSAHDALRRQTCNYPAKSNGTHRAGIGSSMTEHTDTLPACRRFCCANHPSNSCTEEHLTTARLATGFEPSIYPATEEISSIQVEYQTIAAWQ
jgi:hypothetical protein